MRGAKASWLAGGRLLPYTHLVVLSMLFINGLQGLVCLICETLP